jgi:hypothetical protein
MTETSNQQPDLPCVNPNVETQVIWKNKAAGILQKVNSSTVKDLNSSEVDEIQGMNSKE